MGLAFSLSSFACVGPFVGTLLAASVTGGGLRPLLGMVAFATGLALPFFVLALFPSYLQRMPRSGGWLARVKVVMGFIILAASLKYVAAIDQTAGWGFLTRGRFLAAWIVLFSMAGLYLLGFVRIEGVKPEDRMGLGRLLTGMALLIFAISLWPGMTGGPLGSLDAYVPAAEAGSGGVSAANSLNWIKDQYQAALDQARREGKLLFVNFTGVACANCHWMEANMFPRPEVTAALRGFVLAELYTDRSDAVSDANANMEQSKFQTIATPFYAILDGDEHVIATFAGKTGDTAEFVAFLQKGAVAPPAAQAQSAKAAFTTLEGAPVDTTGKVVVMNFWATWCIPCLSEIPSFNRMQRDLAPKGVVVLGVAMDEDGAAVVKPFLKKHPIEYTLALGSDAIRKQFGVEDEGGYPVTLIFDRNGKQVERLVGGKSEGELRAAVQQAL
jgi:thiol:disulfide interchange protein DsbD